MGTKDKLKNTWSTIKVKMEDTLTFKVNDPKNKQGRVSPLNKDFYKKPFGKSNKITNVIKPGTKSTR
tara:strand:+ start:247 stop:447 length:201 start_codon:yes stop_codon:yes gene_type:complete